MVKKIVILNDFIRYCLDLDLGMKDVARSMQYLLSYQVSKATKLEVETIYDNFNFDKFIELNTLPNHIDSTKENAWAYYCKNITKEAEDYLVKYLKDTIVIGYHLTNLMVEVLKRNNIIFVDTFETSYRYMQDSYLGFRTNIDEIRDYLLSNSLNVNTMYTYANYLKAFYRRRQYYELDKDSCLLLGQTSKDSVLIKEDNSFVSLEEYKDKILEMSKKYNTLYYKMHPYEPLNNNMKEFLLSIPNAREENKNFYELMSQDGIKEVFGLNSGGISEAKFFGKKTTFLFTKAHNYYQDENIIKDYTTFIILSSNSYIFKINFWAELFSFVIPTYKVTKQEDVHFDNYQSMYASFIKISSNYEFNIYSIFDINRSMHGYSAKIDNLLKQTDYNKSLENLKNLEDKVKNYEERLNYHDFLLKKSSNRFKKIFLNITLGFLPVKSLRKSLRDKYIRY